MIKFAIKNLLTRKSKIILSALSIVMATTIGLLAFNISEQVNDGITNTVGYYGVLVGPTGNEAQLVLNTMFFTGAPEGTISYENYEALKADYRVSEAVPFAMGDSYKSYKLVGTTPGFLNKLNIKSGRLFDESFEATLGYNAAKNTGLKVGDQFVGSHGISEGEGHNHESNPYRVAGVLSKTNTAYDNVIFINISDVWAVHDHHEEHATDEHTEEEHATDEHTDEEHATEEHADEEHEHKGEVTAILLKTNSTMFTEQIISEYNQKAGIQAINPHSAAREIMENVDLSKQIIFVLCFVIGIMALMIIYIITLLNVQDSKKDIKLMRLIGISKDKINAVLIIQNFIVTTAAIVFSVLLCRALLFAVNSFTSGMGIVVNYMKFYIEELYIVTGILVFSFIPMFIANIKSFKKDPIND